MTFEPVQATAFSAQIAANLRLRIASRELKPGDHLVEGAVAAAYSVSRAPVREALKQLETEGLVESRKRGVFVTGLSDADVEELISLRTSIETLATRLAMQNAQASDWEAMEAAIEKMRAAAEANSPVDFAAADMTFHGIVYRASGHKRLSHVWGIYAESFTVILHLSKKTQQDLIDGTASHQHLLNLLRGDDPERAVAGVHEHLQGTRRLFLAAVGSTSEAAEK